MNLSHDLSISRVLLRIGKWLRRTNGKAVEVNTAQIIDFHCRVFAAARGLRLILLEKNRHRR